MTARLDRKSMDFIAEIYDLLLDPTLWPCHLDRYIGFFGAAGASLHTFDPSYRDHELSVLTSNYDPRLFQIYQTRFVEHDYPAFEKLLRSAKRGYVSDFELLGMSRERQASHPPVAHLTEHFGVRHRAATRLNLHGAWQDVLAVQFDKDRGPISAAENATAGVFLPHFAKVVEMNRAFSVLKSRFHAVMAALDRYHIGVFILSLNGTVILHNREADRILGLRDGLSLDHSKRPTAMRHAEAGRLKDAISKASAAANAKGDRANTVLSVSRRSGGDGLVVEVSPMRDRGIELDRDFKGVMMLVIDPMRTDMVSIEGMRELYGLTDAETACCRLMAEGMGTDDIADAQNLSRETVRTYVKHILQKTGARNRAQLVHLAHIVNLPIDQPDDATD